MSDAVSDSIIVDADVAAVFDVIGDIAAYPDWQDEVTAAEVLETGDDGWVVRARLTIDAQLFTTTMVLAYTYTDDSMSWELEEGDKVRRNDGTYRLEALADGRTAVTFEAAVEPSVRVPSMLRRKAARRIVEQALSGMKRQVESR